MSEEIHQKNVLGEKLEECSIDPATGWFRDGCCNTNETDYGIHGLRTSYYKIFRVGKNSW